MTKRLIESERGVGLGRIGVSETWITSGVWAVRKDLVFAAQRDIAYLLALITPLTPDNRIPEGRDMKLDDVKMASALGPEKGLIRFWKTPVILDTGKDEIRVYVAKRPMSEAPDAPLSCYAGVSQYLQDELELPNEIWGHKSESKPWMTTSPVYEIPYGQPLKPSSAVKFLMPMHGVGMGGRSGAFEIMKDIPFSMWSAMGGFREEK